MRFITMPFIGGAYADDTKPYDQQDCVNYMPEMAEGPGGRSPSIERGVPGMRRIVDAGDGPVRGLHNCEGILFMVRGQTLYQVNADYSLTSLGTIPGVGRCPMTHNTVNNGYQVTVVNGNAGYVYNTATSDFVQITDDGFYGSIMCDFCDNYICHLEPYGRFWFISDLSDATSFTSGQTYQAEASPDRINSLIVDHRQVWALGARTCEVFVDSPTFNDDSGVEVLVQVFQRSEGTLMEEGCASVFARGQLDNTIYFLGSDGIVYRADGYTPVRVSNFAVEQDIAKCNLSQCYAYTWVDHGHKVFYLTFPDGHTWGYDVATQLWHRRQSYGRNNWRVSCLENWNGVWIAGDAIDGRLYALDWNVFDEDGAPLVAERTSPYSTEAQNRILQAAMEVVMDTGYGALNGDNYVNLAYSDDGGRNYSNWKQVSLGKVGQYGTRVQFFRLGQFRSRIFRLQVSSPVKRDLIAVSGVFKEAA